MLYHDTNVQTVHVKTLLLHSWYILCTGTAVCTGMVFMLNHQSTDPPGKIAKPARGKLNKENEHFPVPGRA